MKVFLDTNVLVSAFATRGLCADVLRAVLVGHELLVGEVVLEEMERVLIEKFRMPAESVKDILDFLREYQVVPRPAEPADVELADVDDKWVVASALLGEAEVLVTGDAELQTLEEISGLRIISPRTFWSLIQQN